MNFDFMASFHRNLKTGARRAPNRKLELEQQFVGDRFERNLVRLLAAHLTELARPASGRTTRPGRIATHRRHGPIDHAGPHEPAPRELVVAGRIQTHRPPEDRVAAAAGSRSIRSVR